MSHCLDKFIQPMTAFQKIFALALSFQIHDAKDVPKITTKVTKVQKIHARHPKIIEINYVLQSGSVKNYLKSSC